MKKHFNKNTSTLIGGGVFNLQEIKKLTAKIANLIKDYFQSEGDNLIFLLEGNLGSGKTTFVKLLAKNLGIKENVISPSFLIWRTYFFSTKKKKCFFHHIDCYRIKSKKELENLGIFELINNSQNSVFLIEWGEKIERFLAMPKLVIKFIFLNQKERLLIFVFQK